MKRLPNYPTTRRQRWNIKRDAARVERALFNAEVEAEFVALKAKIDAELAWEQAVAGSKWSARDKKRPKHLRAAKWQGGVVTLLVLILCSFYVPPEDGPRTPTNPADDYCSISYPSPWDGTPQYPIGC